MAILLHEAFTHAGKTVFVHDWDSQGTSNKALTQIIGNPPSNHNGRTVIYDTPPNLEHTATAAAIRSADTVLVFTSPSPADIWEADGALAQPDIGMLRTRPSLVPQQPGDSPTTITNSHEIGPHS